MGAYRRAVGIILPAKSRPAGKIQNENDQVTESSLQTEPKTRDSPARHELTTVELRTYIVEDNATIRENLIGTLEELA